ncbi:N-6 DNA methylase [Larkinella rosea]|uniref:N-6 DNA methylase n=1 Tax=Larkinella rosea TaxID=2025312 RepID=A0A3P1BSA2_9BACT|nr:N-6 DNA methylase [Larkinella rosea]RRB03968.1 N-6 DNA methylase [Larkinella rosea]
MSKQQLNTDSPLSVKIEDDKIFAPLKDKWLIINPLERVRQNYITILVNQYGFALQQIEQDVELNYFKPGQGKAKADIVVWKSEQDRKEGKKPIIVVECKAQNITIHEEDYFQGSNFAFWIEADFFVMTNEKETKFFKVIKEYTPRVIEEVVELPTFKDFSNSKKLHEFETKTKAFTREEFSKVLFKCHNIIRNNDKLSPEAAFDEISKILFIKIRYERQHSISKAIFSEKVFQKLKDSFENTTINTSLPFYQHLFEQTKKSFIDDDLFDPNDSLKIRENSFLQTVRELEKFNLSNTSDDIKGIAFEEFLGRTFRGELGQFFTPRTIVNYMTEVLDPQEGETICDPCCGSGGFLIKAFEYVRDKIEKHIHAIKGEVKKRYYTEEYDRLSKKDQLIVDQKVQKHFKSLNEELDLNNPNGRLRRLSYNCIFGTDANPRMARTAKMNMIMHGDGHGGVHHHDGLLNVNGIYDGRFDIILTNPPFGARVEKTLNITISDLPSTARIEQYKARYGEDYEEIAVAQIRNNLDKPLLNLFDVGQFSGLTEVLFMERCLNLLKPGGRMGIVLPEGVLNNSALQKIREYIESRAKLINITSIPQDVFIASGATVKPSLIFLRKFTEIEDAQYKQIVKEETERVNLMYNSQLTKVTEEHATQRAELKANKFKDGLRDIDKQYREKRRAIEEEMAELIKHSVKTRFNYPVPMVEVEKAGISSTGAKIDNELLDVAKEYRAYRMSNKLWEDKGEGGNYFINDDDSMSYLSLSDVNSNDQKKSIITENFM